MHGIIQPHSRLNLVRLRATMPKAFGLNILNYFFLFLKDKEEVKNAHNCPAIPSTQACTPSGYHAKGWGIIYKKQTAKITFCGLLFFVNRLVAYIRLKSSSDGPKS